MSASSPYKPLEAVGCSIVQDWGDGEPTVVGTVASPQWAQHLVDCHQLWLEQDGRPIEVEGPSPSN